MPAGKGELCAAPGCTRIPAPHSDLCYGCLTAIGQRLTLRTETTVKLYAVAGAGLVKIGVTTRDMKTRLSGLQVGSPVKLELLGYTSAPSVTEQAIHVALRQWHSHGEWFRRSAEVERFVTWIVAKDSESLVRWLDDDTIRRVSRW